MNTKIQESKQVIIQSIGTANPSCARILEDSLQLPQELVLTQLYNAPSVLFPNVDLELAEELKIQLTKLGLEVDLKDAKEQIRFTNEKFEVSVNVQEIKDLPHVLKNLSEFLGTNIQDCVQLLGDERRIVIGGVSEATALAMKKRIPAAICYTNPKLDYYTIRFNAPISTNEIKTLMASGIQKSQMDIENGHVRDLDYQQSQKIWKKYQTNNEIQIINQSHQIISIELVNFNLEYKNHLDLLQNTIGIPSEILPQIHSDMPVVLFDTITRHNASAIIHSMDNLGLKYNINEVDVSPKSIEANDIEDQVQFKKVMNQFFNLNNKKSERNWKSEHKVPHLIALYIKDQLQTINCKVKMN